MFDPEKDSTLRFYVDYQKFNKGKICDSYAITRLDKSTDLLVESTTFATIDMNSGYLQDQIAKDDCDKIIITYYRSLFRFTRIPFGLNHAQGTF